MIDVDIVINDEKINSKLNRLEYLFSGPMIAALLDQGVVQLLQADAMRRFRTQGASDGAEWAPLRDSTLDIRASDGYPYPMFPINVRTGELSDYVLHGLGDTAVIGDYAQLTWPDPLPDSGNLKHAYRQAQRGNQAKNSPPRPVVQLSVQGMTAIYLALTTPIRKALRRP